VEENTYEKLDKLKITERKTAVGDSVSEIDDEIKGDSEEEEKVDY
jgi:hypothetical protein